MLLFARGAGIHVDFHANRHFDDLRCFPGHLISPSLRRERRRKAKATPLLKYHKRGNVAENRRSQIAFVQANSTG
jgi:hypothetical protein